MTRPPAHRKPARPTTGEALWGVRVWNDDTTPMHEVTALLEEVIGLDHDMAFDEMFRIHLTGSAVVAIDCRTAVEAMIAAAEARIEARGLALSVTPAPGLSAAEIASEDAKREAFRAERAARHRQGAWIAVALVALLVLLVTLSRRA